jgi:phage terminase large subunit-like protein
MSKVTLSLEELKKLPKDQLFELAVKLDNHQRVIKNNKLEVYLENKNSGQTAFHRAPHRIRIYLGGNRSGKTTAGVNEFQMLMRGIHPYRTTKLPLKGLIVAQDFTTHVNDIIVPKIEEWFPPEVIPEKKRKKNAQGVYTHFGLTNDGKIDIKSHDQKLKVYEGSDYDIVWFDEPPPQDIFKAVWRGLTDRGGICFITGTPIVEPWMYDKICEADKTDMQGNIWYQYVNSYENAKNIGEGDEELGIKRLREFEDELDPEEREARIKGHFLHLSGLIFKTWRRKDHWVKPFAWPEHWPIWYSVDPHPRKPWAVSFIGFSPKGYKFLISSAYVEGICEDVARTIFEMRDAIETTGGKPKITRGYIDNYASVESMVKKVTIIDELNSHLYPFLPKVQTAPKNVSQKISIFKEWLKVQDTKYGPMPKFMAFNCAENMDFLYEIEHYRWAKKKGRALNAALKDAPVKEDDDILDTILQVALVVGNDSDGERKEEKINYRKQFNGR